MTIGKKRILSALTAALLLLLLLSPALSLADTARVATNGGCLRLRSGPGKGYGIVTTFPNGTRVNVLSYGSSWCQVNAAGCIGYMSTRYLSFGESAYTYQPAWVPQPYNPQPYNPQPYNPQPYNPQPWPQPQPQPQPWPNTWPEPQPPQPWPVGPGFSW